MHSSFRVPPGFLAAVAMMLLAPAAAQASTTYCVPAPCSPGTAEPSIQAALTAAAGDADTDTIQIAAATLTHAEVAPSGTAIDAVSNPVDIVGAGQTQTTVPSPATPSLLPAIELLEPASEISDLQIALNSGDGSVGLWLVGSAEGITVSFSDSAAVGVVGVRMDLAASLTQSTVAVPHTFVSAAIAGIAGGGGMTGALIQDSTLSGATAVISAGTLNLRRVRASGVQFVLQAPGATSLDVQDSLVELLPGPPPGSSPVPASALAAVNFDAAGTASVVARNVTLVGSGEAATAGAVAYTDGAGHDANMELHDAIISGFGHSLFTTQASGGGPASITTAFSGYDSSTNSTAGGGAIPTESNHIGSDPEFVSSANFHLQSTSPLIDAGTPAALGPGESTTDLGGLPRLLDGNGNCNARRDIGAFEFSPSTFAVPVTATPGSAQQGHPISFQASGCDPDPNISPSYQWSFDDGATATGASVSHAFAAPGTHGATVTVTDTAGRIGTGTTSVTVTVPPDTTAPQTRIRGFSLNRAARRATIRFSSSESHSTFLCKLDGRPYRACRSPKTFRRLSLGRHRIRVRARDLAGNTDPTPASRRFRLAR